MAPDLVVITYPYHYHMTQLAIKQAVRFLQPRSIYVLHDSILKSQFGWKVAGNHIRNDLRKMGIDAMSIPFEAISETINEPRGWIRQQFVKLNLHKILNGESWVVLDGDAIMQTSLDPQKYTYINEHDRLPIHHRNFTNYVLDLNYRDIEYNGKPISFSAIPMRHIQRSTLAALEDHVFSLHGKNLKAIYDSLSGPNKQRYMEISEFELINHFESQILGKKLDFKPIACRFVTTDRFISDWKIDDDLYVLAGQDQLPQEWYEQQGIKINQEIWDQLYSKKILQQ